MSTLSVHHRNSNRLQIHDRRVHQREKNVEIVNHDVVNYIDIQAARSENSQSMHFKEHRARDNFLHGSDGWIEAFYMTHLQDATPSRGGCNQSVRFAKRRPPWAFDQYVQAAVQELATDTSVLFRRHRQADGLHTFRRQR